MKGGDSALLPTREREAADTVDGADARRPRRWVVKVGSALLTDSASGLNAELIEGWAAQIAVLRAAGIQVVFVSSGAIAAGMKRLGWRRRPHAVYQLQAAAALGQMVLIQTYEQAFQRHAMRTAQVLLTHDDLADRTRYLNARSTLRTLLDLDVVPVVNENDTVVTDEIRFGDNDTLGALVANLIEAELLVLLTDQSGLFDRDPRHHADARLIESARAGDPALLAMAGPGGVLGRGGMRTKLHAAEKAARSGTATVITQGAQADVLVKLQKGENPGTVLLPSSGRLAARKQWLAGNLHVRGTLTLDAGAVRVLREQGRSLLPVGVRGATGAFERGDMVVCMDPDGAEIARGLVNYDATETARILGRPSAEIESILGYVDEPELIHRDNMVLL